MHCLCRLFLQEKLLSLYNSFRNTHIKKVYMYFYEIISTHTYLLRNDKIYREHIN